MQLVRRNPVALWGDNVYRRVVWDVKSRLAGNARGKASYLYLEKVGGVRFRLSPTPLQQSATAVKRVAECNMAGGLTGLDWTDGTGNTTYRSEFLHPDDQRPNQTVRIKKRTPPRP